MTEHPHGYIGFSHCLDCAKHAYEELGRENERLKAIVDASGGESCCSTFDAMKQRLEQENVALKEQISARSDFNTDD